MYCLVISNHISLTTFFQLLSFLRFIDLEENDRYIEISRAHLVIIIYLFLISVGK